MRVLVVDDSEGDRILARREILKGVADATFSEVGGPEAFEAALADADFDVAVTDYRLGWTDGLAVLRRIKAIRPAIPVLMLTSSGNEEVAVQAMKEGAADYILKTQLGFDRLSRAVAAAVGVARQQNELARAERRYGELFRSVPVGLALCFSDGEIREANPTLTALLGRPPDSVSGLSLPALFEDGGAAWEAALSGAAPEVRIRRPDSRTAWAALRASTDDRGNVECALTDVTETKRASEERDALLGELYHRVNNTLQMLIGMVNAQVARATDPVIRQMLLDLTGRIYAISLVQQRLYEAERFTDVAFDQFLQDLAALVAGTSEIRVRLDLSPLSLPLDQAIPIGLAANELLTNSLKHAFPGETTGEITIRLARKQDVTVLEVADDGAGLPPTAERRVGYGTRLLTLLMRQAGAGMDVNSEPAKGTRTTVRIPARGKP